MSNSDFVLLDTCIWIEYFRRRQPDLANEAENLIQSKRAVTCGIVLHELSFGIKNERERTEVLDSLDGLKHFPMGYELWIKSGTFSKRVRNKGVNIPLSDTLLSFIAIEYNISLFTIDKHFELISDLKLYR